MAKSKVKELPPRDAMSRTGMRRITRTQNRFAMMRESEAAKITDAYECHVEDQFREYLLALPPNTRVTKGMQHIWNWITATFAVEYTDTACLHFHLTVLLMVVVEKLCQHGFLEPTRPSEPEYEFTRTNEPAPVGEPWE
jgi:hypothetical protein